jgi:hypothetical protein
MPVCRRSRSGHLGLRTVDPVAPARSLLADIGDIGKRGRGLGIKDSVEPGLGDQLADRGQLHINSRG